ncbi:DHH phosphoesterase [Cryphonectria parasitica EP155]|uniref:DHH phosphoesterase n=1 Tax=Cryphonectria parasitica (strain ATCC 38755 / EP155) TaxID=660469 RepID=A0A9P4Y5E1_CRYP1|nr:DHH phosphoesterase [Cryphonectria parasitica EP155]KAF3767274.1 DHH phosphoesterase [Cryphonectria parasitica EP155]
MPPPRNLRAFLDLARRSLTAPAGQRPSPLTFVVGNESGDLDSLCSAVLFAYFRSHASPHYKLHIPLANIPRQDLPLRPELGAALAYAGVKSQDLLTLSDLDEVTTTDSLNPEDTRWVLVDHNALTGDLAERFTSRIVGCVDHHEDENVVAVNTGDEPRVLKKTGSCVSLVVEYCRNIWDDLSKQHTQEAGDENQRDIDAGLARIALSAIFLDTNNLKSKAKTTELDIEIAEYLEAKLGGDYNRKKYYKELSELKEDISQFSYSDNFRKDYKAWTEAGMVLGTASIPQGFHYMLNHLGDKETLIEEFRKFAAEKQCDIACIMTSSAKDDGVFKRNLLVWGFNPKAVKAVDKFIEMHGEALGLTPFHDGALDYKSDDEVRYCWYQNVTRNSRKQLAPMLRSAMTEVARL